MRVMVISATGSSKVPALIDKDSGVIEYNDGEISHVLHEKMLNKKIMVVKDAPKIKETEAIVDEKVISAELETVAPELPQTDSAPDSPSEDRSNKGQKKKNKKK